MGETETTTAHSAAQAMLDTFASVGAIRFDVTRTTRAGGKEWFRRSVSLADLALTLPAMLDTAIAGERNVIVRPHGPGVSFIQLDDLAADQLPRVAPAAFAGAPGRTPPRAVRPASPGALISRTSTRPTSRASRFAKHAQAA